MEYITGDITENTSGLIIHGVNCQGVMGSGVALAIKTRWPVVYTSYMKHKQGKEVLGENQYIYIEDGLYVANCWTQEFYGKDGKVYADIDAVKRCVTKAFDFCDEYNLELKTPLIASGLAGLSWEHDVEPIFKKLQNVYPDVVVKVYVFK